MDHIRETLKQISKSKARQMSIETEEPQNAELAIEKRREALRKSLGLTDLRHTFDTFIVSKATKKVCEAAKSMVYSEHPLMLLIYGGIGNGKTHLCEAVCIGLYQKGIRCQVTLWSELRRQLLQAMHRPKPNQSDYDTIFENFRQRSHVIIDDVGMGSKGTEWEMCELEDIINYRYRERLFTLMTTNRTLEELPERVVSRFFDPEVGEVVLNEGDDYRLQRRQR